jgi:hypothetical protein
VQVILWQQHYFTCADLDSVTTVNAQLHAAGCNEVERHDVPRCGQIRLTILRSHPATDAPRRREFRLQKYASGKLYDTQDVR